MSIFGRLGVVLALSITGVSWAQTEAPPSMPEARTVEVVLRDFEFVPSTITLRRSEPVRLRLVNNGSGGHNFSAPSFFQSATISSEDQQLLKDGKIEVGKGETRELRLVPQRVGTYKLHCTHFLHSGFGMKGQVVVTE